MYEVHSLYRIGTVLGNSQNYFHGTIKKLMINQTLVSMNLNDSTKVPVRSILLLKKLSLLKTHLF